MKKKRRIQLPLRFGLLFLLPLLAIVLLSIIRYPDKPKIEFDVTGNFGKKQIVVPLPKTDPAGDLMAYLQEKKINVQDGVVASESALLIVLVDGTSVWFNSGRDVKSQVDSLQIIRDRLTIEGRSARKIDLRFSDPIVIY